MKKFYLLFFFMVSLTYGQIPAYYSSIDFTQTGNNLKNQLTTLVTNTHTTQIPYTASTTDTWDVIKTGDLDPSNPENVLLFYGWNDTDDIVNNDRSRDKNLSCHTSSCTGLWVREHVYARSIGTPNLGFEFAGSDVHNLHAIDNSRNGTRSNRLFENTAPNIASTTTANGNWYPGDEWRGDVARIIMYMYLRYPTQCLPNNIGVSASTYAPNADIPNMFLDWNAIDPPSVHEMNRNNAIQNAQGNRNPFIDNPYLATIIWNGPTTTDSWNTLPTNQYELANVTIYPTVTSDIVYITNSTSESYQYSLTNTYGQQVDANTTKNSIDISRYAKGLYFLTVQANNQTKTVKILKQ